MNFLMQTVIATFLGFLRVMRRIEAINLRVSAPLNVLPYRVLPATCPLSQSFGHTPTSAGTGKITHNSGSGLLVELSLTHTLLL